MPLYFWSHVVPFLAGCVSVIVSHWLGFAHGWSRGHIQGHLHGWNAAVRRYQDPSYVEYCRANGLDIPQEAKEC